MVQFLQVIIRLLSHHSLAVPRLARLCLFVFIILHMNLQYVYHTVSYVFDNISALLAFY